MFRYSRRARWRDEENRLIRMQAGKDAGGCFYFIQALPGWKKAELQGRSVS